MDFEEAKELMKSKISDEKLRKHCIAVAAIMRAIAREIGENEEKFAIAGVLHDLDFELTRETPEKHGLLAIEMLGDEIDEEIKHAIAAHNFERTRVMPSSKLDYALIASDAISGLIIAAALVMPDKKLASVRVETIAKKFKQRDFARRCNREHMLYCEKLGISRERFFKLALKALQAIAGELGL